MSTSTTRSAHSLTDRYVVAATRSVHEAQRPELERELRERIGDETDALVADGVTPADAERAALTGLGDPAATAASYVDRPLQLIGPRYFLMWWRLLKMLYSVVLPIVTIVVLLAQIVAQSPIGEAIGSTVVTALSLTVHIGFWTTLVFAVLERTPGTDVRTEWTPDLLPEIADDSRPSRVSELVGSLVFLAIFAGWILWQPFSPWPADAAGEPVPVLDPELWSFWLPYFLALIALEMLFAVAVYRRGWNWWFAGANLVLNAAFTVPALWLFLTGRLLSDEVLELMRWPWGEGGDASAIVVTIIVIVVVGASVWDVIDGGLRAWRAQRGTRAVTA